jgi:2-phospho-L-lactate guanylyltransferase
MTRRRQVCGVLPVKPFSAAKSRLSGVLDAAERIALARAMFEDVLGTLLQCDTLPHVMVVTADEEVAVRARTAGAFVLGESAPGGFNGAILSAIAKLSGTPEAGILVVPADVPQLCCAAVECAVEHLDAPSAVVLQRASDGGTNLLGCRPPGVIAPMFGPGSFDAHCVAALRAGLVPRILEWPGLDLDLDRPADLPAFLRLETATRSHARVAHALSRGTISRAIVSI